MTLHITSFHSEYILQASDRLLSKRVRGRHRRHDRAANKTVLLSAPDAFVSVCYAGAAYVGSKPTDHAIAECLLGQQIEYSSTRLLPTWEPGLESVVRCDDVGSVVQQAILSLHKRLLGDPAFPGDQVVMISVSGWRWPMGSTGQHHRRAISPDDAVPIQWVFEIAKQGQPRFEDTTLNELLAPGRALLTAMPPWPSQDEMIGLEERLNTPRASTHDQGRALAEGLADIGSPHPQIGEDVTLLVLPHPRLQAVATFDYFGQNYEDRPPASPFPPGRYTPWLVSHNAVMRPAEAVGDHLVQANAYQLRLIGTPSESAKIHYLQTQKRVATPRRSRTTLGDPT